MQAVMDLGQVIESIAAAATPTDAFAHYSGFLKDQGYDRVVYSLLTDHPSLGLKRQDGLATSYPADWMARYISQDYFNLDPVMARVRRSRQPFFWSEVTDDPELSAPERRVMEEADDAGVSDGIAISLAGGPGEMVGIGIARNGKGENGGKDYATFSAAYLLTTYFHCAYREMMQKPAASSTLTERQRDILSWAAEGKSNSTIAVILGISKKNVEYHLRGAYDRLDACNRTSAITKALHGGLISPVSVNPRLLPSR